MIFEAQGGFDGFEWIKPANPSDFDVFGSFDGTSRLEKWVPIKVLRVRMDAKSGFMPSDFPWLGADVLILREKAAAELHSVLSGSGELLPLETDDGIQLYAFNCTKIVDALDENQSAIVRFPSTGRIMGVTKAVMKAKTINGINVFRLPHRASSTYVSDVFVSSFMKANLVGLKFNRVLLSNSV